MRVSVAAVAGTFFFILLLSSQPTTAQVADLVEITPLAQSETGGCYVGNSGADSTIFLRLWPGFTGCDLFDGNNDLCVSRLEFPGDQPNGATISFGDSSLLRPSVSGDGAFAWFSTNIDLCLIQTDTVQQDICFNLPPNLYVHSATVSPQGDRVGIVPRDLNNFNYPANAIQVHFASFPTLPLLNTYHLIAPLIYPESVDFMARGNWIVFDATDNQFGGGSWGLYVVNRATGEVRTLAAPVAGYELRNPAFAQTSDEVIAFDAFETATGQTTILTANIVTAQVREIAQITFAFLGQPSFSGDDTFIIFNREDPAQFTTASLRMRALAADRITPVGVEQSWIPDSGYGVIYRRGTFDTTEVPCASGADPGDVENTLRIGKNAVPGLIDLTWASSCLGGATDYTIHEGAVGSWYSHTSVLCSTATATSWNGLSPAGGGRYFLIVPVSAAAEGLYGADSADVQRPVSAVPCRTSQVVVSCP